MSVTGTPAGGKTHILWDHDGVLVHTEPWYFEATRRCLAELDVHVVPADYLRLMADGRSLWELAEARGVAAATISVHRARRDVLYQQFLVEQPIDIAGVEPLLQQLAQQFAMAVVTTAKRADFELIHARRNITAHMQFVLTNGDYARSKPAPDPYLAALQRFGIGADRAVAVEDSSRGLRAALAAGIDCVVVDNEFTRAQDFAGASARIGSLAELPALLRTPRRAW